MALAISSQGRSLESLKLMSLCWSASHTLRVSDLNVGRWAAEGHGDLLETGVKGQLPSVADAAGVIGGQQVDLGRLHGFLHPLQDLQRRRENAENGIRNHGSFTFVGNAASISTLQIRARIRLQAGAFKPLQQNKAVKGSHIEHF